MKILLAILGALLILALPWWALVMVLGVGALWLWAWDRVEMRRHDREHIEPTEARRR